jgi:hypothetical protein
MKLLGAYKSNLAPFHYDELLKLLEQAVELGEFSGNKTFDSDAFERLRQQAQEFGDLPLASAGQRVTDDSINNPLALLRARFEALSQESEDFKTRAKALISVLEKDTVLLEQLLAGANLEDWARLKPTIEDALRFQWDFAMGHGAVSPDIVLQDPASGVVYDSRPPVTTSLNSDTGEIHSGLVPPAGVREVKVKDMKWTYTSVGEKEELFGDDWAELSLLEDRPRINFTQNPRVEILLPHGVDSSPFQVTGITAGGTLPIFVRVLLQPRRTSTVLTTTNRVTSPPVLNGSASNFLLEVKPTDQIYVEAFQSATLAATGTFKLRLVFYDASGTIINDVLGNPLRVSGHSVTPAITPEKYSALLTVPNVAGIARAKLEAVLDNFTTGTWTVTGYRVHQPLFLGTKSINADEVDIYTNDQVYFPIQDYVVDDSGQVTFKGVSDGITLSVRFTELYPGYQCSINEKDWSPIVMLDADHPYPDGETNFLPIDIQPVFENDIKIADNFPLTDELGVPSGLFMRMLSRPQLDFYLRVSTEAIGSRPGAEALLEVEFERPAYINGLSLAPFVNFPMRLISFEVQGLTSDTRHLVYEGETVVDRPLTVRFPRQLVRRVFLKLFQENYTLKEHVIDPPDKLRRDALGAVQSSLPYSVRRIQRAVVKRLRGVQYDFGLEHIVGQDWSFTLPGVFIIGPLRFTGAPEVLRLDVDVIGSPEIYLCFRALDASGIEKDVQLQGMLLSSGSAVVFPFAPTVERIKVTTTNLYLKVVFRTEEDMIERYLVQATQV